MPDVNEKTDPTRAAASTSSRFSLPFRERFSAPIWRFRPALRTASVVRTLKDQLIPRIFLSLRSTNMPEPHADVRQRETSDDIKQFAALTLDQNDDAAAVFVDGLLKRGASVESVFVDWLAPAARYLGELWEDDTADFVTVTTGVSRLQRILRELGDRFCERPVQIANASSALLTTVVGEQHSFGLSMVAEFFRRDGWNLCTGPFDSHRELTSLIHNHWFDVVGFSVSSERGLDALKRDITSIRRDSRNQSVGIMLGGPMMLAHPELVTSMGADMMSSDATRAPQMAQNLIAHKKSLMLESMTDGATSHLATRDS